MDNQLEYQTALEFIEGLEGMAVLDKNGRYTFVSKGWQQYTGYIAEQALGKYVWEVFPETHAKHVLKTGKPIIGRPVVKHNITAFTSYFPRFGDDGSITGCFLYIIINGMRDAHAINKQIIDLTSQLEYYKQELSRERGARYGLDHIIGKSNVIEQLKGQIMQAARSASTVLIEGETGCGKELIAHSIHALSMRHTQNFIRVNCSAIPAELMESEFFGYASGAFTGAVKGGKSGRFVMANHGSIFLDEINLLSPVMQPKFLRVLQEREIDPVGGNKSIPIDIRVISASNVPLEHLVETGKFRSDLYYRLNVIKIYAPPLRDRKEDIPLLANHLISQLNHQLGMVVDGIDSEAMSLLLSYDWPGNVRELQNAIESAMNASDGSYLYEKDFERLNRRAHRRKALEEGATSDYHLKSAVQIYERKLIKEALTAAGESRVKAAKLLGISRAVLYQKMERYGIS